MQLSTISSPSIHSLNAKSSSNASLFWPYIFSAPSPGRRDNVCTSSFKHKCAERLVHINDHLPSCKTGSSHMIRNADRPGVLHACEPMLQAYAIESLHSCIYPTRRLFIHMRARDRSATGQYRSTKICVCTSRVMLETIQVSKARPAADSSTHFNAF